MESAPRFWPGLFAVAGSALLLLSLWLHWYTLRIPDSALTQAQHLAGQFGVLGPYVDAAARAIRRAGTLHADAWQVFKQIDVALAVCGSLSVLLAGLAVTGRATGTGKLLAPIGGVAASLCLFRIISPPGSSGWLHPALGAYLALGSAVAVVAGGLLLDREPEPAAFTSLPRGPVHAVPASIPPPGH
jgi:hypothetical protein